VAFICNATLFCVRKGNSKEQRHEAEETEENEEVSQFNDASNGRTDVRPFAFASSSAFLRAFFNDSGSFATLAGIRRAAFD
jgi:hypothetical protein